MALALGALLYLLLEAHKLDRSLNEAIDILEVVPQDASPLEVERGIEATVLEQHAEVGAEYDNVREKIKRFEGFRARVYLDGKGHPTQGYGHKLSDETYSSTDSRKFRNDWGNFPRMGKDHAEALFEIDLQKEYGRLRTNYAHNNGGPKGLDLTFDQLPLHAREVLLDMAFNGGGHFGTKFPSMFASLRNGDFHKAGLEMMYRNGEDVLHRPDQVEGTTRAFTSYFIGNNGPDRYAESRRNIFQDPAGDEYSERLVTVAANDRGELVDPETFNGQLNWYTIPSVNNSTGGYYGSTSVNGQKVDRSVGPVGSVGNLDMNKAWEVSGEADERYGPFKTEHEAGASGHDRDLGPIQRMGSSRATYNVARMMRTRLPSSQELSSLTAERTRQGEALQAELKEEQ